MQYEISGPFKAADLFTLKAHVRKGVVVPDYANVRAVPRVGKDEPRFSGTGIYGVLCGGKLIYVGIFTGLGSTLFAGSVVHERWRKHLTFFTMRSPECAASPRNLRRILAELKGAPVAAIAELVGNDPFTIEDLRNRKIGFATGTSTQFNKVRFAAENWNIFQPGNEKEMLEQISFVYARFLPETAGLIGSASRKEAYDFVKSEWLETRERRLFEKFQPACNSQTIVPNKDVDVETFLSALAVEMGLPLLPRSSAIAA
ncbi:hypothetical protein [Shinella sp. G-2]|uniref:hypothetical protein n=1 Tax=Shinella sp. G-2 TaxID=3133141 RepID=UPI003D07D9BC